MEKTRKYPPVARGNVLIGLECCREAKCRSCPYWIKGCSQNAKDALAYIGWLEEQLKEAGKA